MKAELAILLLAAVIATTLYMTGSENNSNKLVLQFENFKMNFGKRYDASEEAYRLSIFEKNLKLIESHNSDPSQTYKLGITQFADMDKEQFINKILVQDLTKKPFVRPQSKLGMTNTPILKAVDWRTSGAVTGVKNQASCGSCWAFSTTGVLESAYFIKKGTLPSYSEQQLVDCCGKQGFQCQGCNGAWPEWALNYVNSKGIVDEASYPYKGVESSTCGVTGGAKILNPNKPWTMLSAGDTNGLKVLVNSQPVSVCLDASNWSLYKSGVFSNCGGTNLNHAVLAVGYQATDVWIVKNSWGTSWGDSGYIRLAAGNTCGIAQHALIGNLA